MNRQKGFITQMGELIDEHRAKQQHKTDNIGALPHHSARLLRWIMPNGGTLILIALLIFTQNIWAKPLLNNRNAPGASATTINYQGRLADSSGNPKDGTFSMSFAIYDAATGGNLVWGPETHAAVPVSNGLFSVGLGSQTTGGIPTTVWNGDRYLEVTVGGETLSPRELIRSVPIAGMALTVPDGAITQAQAPFAATNLNVHGAVREKAKVVTGTFAPLLQGGASWETLTLDISGANFTNKPIGIAQVVNGSAAGHTLALVDFDGSTPTTAKIVFFRPDGQPIPTGRIRYNVILWEN